MKCRSNVFLVVILLTLCFTVSGCASNDTLSKSSKLTVDSANKSGETEITKSDFDVSYHEIILNDKTPLSELSTKLQIPIDEDNENVAIKAAGIVNKNHYSWYQVTYPNKANPDLILEYLYNKTLKKGRIISIDLKKVHTIRGMQVGDHLDKLKQVYGNNMNEEYNSEITNSYSFKLGNYYAYFIIEKKSGKISEIHYDFDSNKAMKEMDIASFD
ncbi:hypothetical protein [Paenibacillus sp. SN-8-1]|uniref:hypothetical protein n=1 Tax=Paenibacillus sp. SN-8-1 TaxID=3435409 RepID=UPI003D9AA98F